MQYILFPWNSPNNGIYPWLIVQYPMGEIEQQMKNSNKKHKSLKVDINTMVEVKNYVLVDDNYLKGLKQVTLGFGNCTTIAVLQYLFNKFGRATLGEK